MRASIETIDRALPDLCQRALPLSVQPDGPGTHLDKVGDFEPLALNLVRTAAHCITIREENGTARVVGKVDRIGLAAHDGKLYCVVG